MPKLYARRVQRIEVEIEDNEIFKYLEDRIRQKNDIKYDQWLKDGKLYHEEHTSHAWDSCDGPATPEQIKAFELINTLRDILLEKQ